MNEKLEREVARSGGRKIKRGKEAMNGSTSNWWQRMGVLGGRSKVRGG